MRPVNWLLFTLLWSHLPQDRQDHLVRNLELLHRMHPECGGPGHCLVLDGRSIVTVGPRLARRLGYKPAQMVGKNVYNFILARDHVLMFAFVQSGIVGAYITLHLRTVQNTMRVTFSTLRLGAQIYMHALDFAQQGYAKRLSRVAIPIY